MKHRAEKSQVRAARFTSIRQGSEPTPGVQGFMQPDFSTEPNLGIPSVNVELSAFRPYSKGTLVQSVT